MQGHSQTATATLMQKLAGFAELCKPRVNSLIVLLPMIGMLLPSRELPPMKLFLLASLGIGLVACPPRRSTSSSTHHRRPDGADACRATASRGGQRR